MKKNAFTLIELLAVIVILAIIALIATPIVLNIISDSKESATLQSAEFYLGAVETAVAKQIIDDPTFKPESCDIQSDGNIKCGNTLVKVEINGEKPTSGTITLENGKIKDIELVLSEKTITKNSEGKLIYEEPSKLLYKIGDEVTFNPGDQDRTWNVIGEDNNTVTLMLNENMSPDEGIQWNAAYNVNVGPVDLLNYLNEVTKDWNNVDLIENYSYINNLDGAVKLKGYQKLEIKDGKAKLTHKDGITVTSVEGISKTRLLSVEELLEIAAITNKNLTKENLNKYIERNLSAINSKIGTSATTVDEIILAVEQMSESELNESEHFELYYLVFSIQDSFGLEPSYNITLPDYLYQNLVSPNWRYWTISSSGGGSDDAWMINMCCETDTIVNFYSDYANGSHSSGVRPVITIPKSKLK